MYLSRLDLFGFKSFAHRTRLDFSEGLTCVIGPNGSGKSNIVDAIRWVLGEQRVTSLRSDKMENVIFNGNNSRKPMGFTEVAMTIENNRKILKTEYDEVVISRRLYRSGESQYFINKSPVRLRDVIDLFMDTGMGANSYSVIELKMVESILSENKSERRLLFEEAAGVVKYKNRRRSALRKLEATQNDLTRLNDIISEVDKNVNTLSRQVSKTRRYLNYTDELKNSEIALACFRYHTHLDRMRPLSNQLEELKNKKDTSHRQITIDEALMEDYKRELISTEQELRTIQNDLVDIDRSVALIKQENAVSETRAEELAKTRERYREEIKDFHQKISFQETTITEYEEHINDLQTEREEIHSTFESHDADYRKKSDVLAKEKAEIDQLNLTFRGELQAVAEQKENLKQKQFQLKLFREDLEALNKRIEKHQQESGTGMNILEERREQKIQLENELNTLLENRSALEKELEQYQDDQKKLETDYQNLVSELEKAKSRQSFYRHLIENYEGHSASTQYVMSGRNMFSGLHGPVSDLLSTSEEIARLVELVLGSTLNYLVVDDTRSAMDIIEHVKTGNKGRITCIPLRQVSQIDFALPDHSGMNLSFLIDQLTFETQYASLVQLLLGDVILTDTLEEGLTLSEKHPGLRFISKKGELIQFNREVSGGVFEKREAALVGRHDQLKQYTQQVERLEAESERLQKNREILRRSILKNETEQREIRTGIEASRQSLFDIEKDIGQLQYEINKHSLEEKADHQEIKDIENSIETILAEISEQESRVSGLESAMNEAERSLIERVKVYDKENEDLRYIQEDVQKFRLQLTNVDNQLQNRKNDIDRARKNIDEYKSGAQNREAEIAAIEQELIRLKDASENRQSSQIEIWEKRDTIETRKQEYDQTYQAIRGKIQTVDEEIRKYRREHDSSVELSRTLELQINENKLKAEGLREQVLREYAEDIEVSIPFEDMNEEEMEEKIELLKSRIKNLGPVNPLAVSEHDKEKERLDFLTGQRDDLLSAEKSLLETISKINKTARSNFVETFEQIRKNFETVFQSFFENGEGTLRLVENEDPLESDIDIIVRTKGRRLQTLSLLSGGEKTLTAISLLFAIYLVKPSPFCILDEVDAPLDDVNITRFTEALNRFSNNTQFIIVTHNKRTMESASAMYGVTMEEEGVSKLVSVKFN